MDIREIQPSTALPNGRLRLLMEGLDDPSSVSVFVGGLQADILGASREAVTIRVPPADSGEIEVRAKLAARARMKIGLVLNDELHPVTNPVVDRHGNVYTTYSGGRGEEVTFGVFQITPDGDTRPFLADIVNPTGLALGPDGRLYVSSRHSGEVFATSFDKQVEKFAVGLGLATGLAFDSKGHLFVGDRSGTIARVSPQGEAEAYCQLEPSVSAYHLAFDPQDNLYVTGPTLATQDCLYRVPPGGEPEILFRGLGRPQGIGFDPEGNLLVAASYRGQKGLYSMAGGQPRLLLSGPMLVGFAYDLERGHLYCVDHSALYRVDL
ncbi:MAG TPA: SMP-30/gluconolactonase/LRE family protein [Acidobacteriota bacterium]|nr:SMP-30/gluconolactonase/LRE family protein [Acidobacteriota bacterium]